MFASRLKAQMQSAASGCWELMFGHSTENPPYQCLYSVQVFTLLMIFENSEPSHLFHIISVKMFSLCLSARHQGTVSLHPHNPSQFISFVIVELHRWSSPCTILQTNWFMKAEIADALFSSWNIHSSKPNLVCITTFSSHNNMCLFEERKGKIQPLRAFGSSWHKHSAERRQEEEAEEGGVTFYSVTFSECDPLFTTRPCFCNIFTPHFCLFLLYSPLQLVPNPFSLMNRSTATVLLSALWFIHLKSPQWNCVCRWRSSHTGRGAVKGDRLELTCWVWPLINTYLINRSSFSFGFVPSLLSRFLFSLYPLNQSNTL